MLYPLLHTTYGWDHYSNILIINCNLQKHHTIIQYNKISFVMWLMFMIFEQNINLNGY